MAGEVRTIFVLLMENRSFDHMLGYLHAANPEVEGLRGDDAWLDQVANHHAGQAYRPFALTNPRAKLKVDPPHGRDAIKIQLGAETLGKHAMDGFVRAYAESKDKPRVDSGANKPPPMGWFSGKELPVYDFLARNFAVCDHWFAPLPAATQPNRLMAMSGFTPFDGNKVPMPDQKLVYDWLEEQGIRWRVYHHGLPFFSLILERLPTTLFSDKFRPFARFYTDVIDEAADEFPQVVFIEPTYSDAPHVNPNNDDHSPNGVANGQAFVLQAYRALTRAKDVFDHSVMIVTYDEHGGFFDHVPPPRVRTDPPPGANYPAFETLGARVPALVISPFVTKGAVHHGVLDHTSILKFIGETFGGGNGYSRVVDDRPVGSVADVLDNPGGTRAAPAPPALASAYLKGPGKGLAAPLPDGGRVPGTLPQSDMERAFQRALDEIRRHPERPPGEYEELLAAFPPQPAP